MHLVYVYCNYKLGVRKRKKEKDGDRERGGGREEKGREIKKGQEGEVNHSIWFEQCCRFTGTWREKLRIYSLLQPVASSRVPIPIELDVPLGLKLHLRHTS